MTVLPTAASLYRVSMIEILSVTVRIVDILLGIVAPIRNRRMTGRDFADDVEVASGELTRDLADDGGRRGHPIDFTPTYSQAFLYVPVRHATRPLRTKGDHHS